jgi:catechol 2,3-dioxygenase-like lactoylglutathione lyase family enzyme
VLHPVVITPDLGRALTFYRDLLGFRVHAEMTHDPVALARLGGPRDARANAVILRAPDGSEIEIASFAAPRGKPRSGAAWPDAGIRSITFIVDGLDALLTRLAAAGHPAMGETMPFAVDGGPIRVAYVQGPDGVVLTLLEHGIRQ